MCWLGCDNTKGFELGLRPVMVLFILLTTERLYRAMNDQGGITFVRCTSFTTGEISGLSAIKSFSQFRGHKSVNVNITITWTF